MIEEYIAFKLGVIYLMFVGIIFENPHETITRPLGVTLGFKTLLHMVNAIVYPVKEDVVSYILFLVLFPLLED